MNILIIGYGSIGKRHARNVKTLGHNVVLLRHSKDNPNNDNFKEYQSLNDVTKNEKIDGAVVCSPNSKHLNDVELLVENDIPFLLEKPPTIDLVSIYAMERLLKEKNFKYYDIGFNLRYFPSLKYIKEFLPRMGKIYSVRVNVGQYLPDWRNVDYRQTVSAKKELGGGVHNELVHEMDYIIWLFGLPEKVVGYVNKVSNLEIATEDICVALLKYKDGYIIELHLDYLSHRHTRTCKIIAETGNLECDINAGKVLYLYRKGNSTVEEIYSVPEKYDFNNTYIEELEHFLEIIRGNKQSMVNITSAINTTKLLEAIKVSSKEERWVEIR